MDKKYSKVSTNMFTKFPNNFVYNIIPSIDMNIRNKYYKSIVKLNFFLCIILKKKPFR